MAAPTFESLRKDIANKKLAPIYLLHGEEGYFIDVLIKDFEQVIPEDEREFNQYIVYASQTEAGKIMDLCMGCPMMAERQMVIVKEAQAVRADQINKLYKYAMSPNPTTVLVIAFRGATAKGKELIAAVKAKGVVFESKPVRDYQIGTYISAYVKDKGLSIEPKSLDMLKDYIGTDISRVYNEIDKLHTILGQGATITPAVIERNIGISKEYNNFELVDALAVRDAAKAMRIAAYFASNPKANPLVMTTAALYGFFSNLLVAYYSPDKTDQGLMKALEMKSAFPLRKVRAGMRSYNPFQIIEIISAIRQFDSRSKGNKSRQNEHDLFHDLIYHILSAPGNISF